MRREDASRIGECKVRLADREELRRRRELSSLASASIRPDTRPPYSLRENSAFSVASSSLARTTRPLLVDPSSDAVADCKRVAFVPVHHSPPGQTGCPLAVQLTRRFGSRFFIITTVRRIAAGWMPPVCD